MIKGCTGKEDLLYLNVLSCQVPVEKSPFERFSSYLQRTSSPNIYYYEIFQFSLSFLSPLLKQITDTFSSIL
jgi:hypothetical protein